MIWSVLRRHCSFEPVRMAEHGVLMKKRGMAPGMSRPANPQVNASCESFIKTLKREGIYAKPPPSLVDVIGLNNGHLAVAGICVVVPAGPSWADSRDKTVSSKWL